MVHGLTYPDEAVRKTEKGKLTVRLWDAQMVNGIIHFPRPEECEIRRVIHEEKQKQFIYEKNFTGLKEFEGGGAHGIVEDIG